MRVEYATNNSGGSWWLSDDDWYALERVGWNVHWVARQDEDSHYRRNVDDDGRWLGALAVSASLETSSLREAISSFQCATGESASALGCSCCGPPHSFSLRGDNDEYLDSYSPDYPTYGDDYDGD